MLCPDPVVAGAVAALAAAPVEVALEAEDLEVLTAPCARITDLECRSFLALDFTAGDAWADFWGSF